MDFDSLGSLAIAGDNPAGSDVRSGAEFEALQAEIDRVNDTSAPGQTDWNRVVKLASEILASQGKDLLVASYLAVGLIKQRQVEGFAQGLKILRDMIVSHWDGLFPPAKRMRGRRNALQYWLDRSDELLGGLNPAPLEQAQVDAMLQHVDDIDGVLREKDDEPPAVFKLASFVRGLPVRVVEQAPPAEAVAGGEVVAAGDGSSGTPGVVPPTTWDEAMAQVDYGLGVLRVAGEYLLGSDPTNPMSYRISRWIAWSGLAQLPYAEGQTTQLPAPEWNLAETLERLRSEGQSETLIAYVEAVLAQCPLWLDPSRLQAEAMTALGESWSAAAAAVRGEAALLVARLPGIKALCFADGTPFASAETIAWLSAGAPAADSGRPAATAAGDEIGEAIAAAAGRIAQGELPAGVAQLQRVIDRTPAPRDRFRGRVQLCQFLIDNQAVINPWPYARGLLDEIERHRLDDWEPMLALAGLRVVYSAIQAAGEAAIGAPSADDILQRIARIDCTVALQLSGTQS